MQPQELATKRRQLAQEYHKKLVELGEIKKKKAKEILILLVTHGTMAKANAYYNATDNGQKEMELVFYCKGLIETMRAVKTEVEIMNNEAHNQY